MSSSSTDSTLDRLTRLTSQARWFFCGLLLLTGALLAWQHVGMERRIELTSGQFDVGVEDDRASGGASVGRVERQGRDVVLRCRLVARAERPYCKLRFDARRPGAGIDMSRFSEITIDASYQGPAGARIGLVLVDAEDGLTQRDRRDTYKINEVDGIDLPADGVAHVPIRWFTVAQWWKDLARPALEHSFTQVDNVVRTEIVTQGLRTEGDYVFAIRAVTLHGKIVSQNQLLMGLVVAWILSALVWSGATAWILRRQHEDSTGALVLLGEVNEALELEARDLAGQAHVDAPTGALNRQGLRAALIDTPGIMADPMSVVFVDIDHFEAINDSHGRAVGDAVLRQLAGMIASRIRSSDQLVRWGGEEFLIVCPMTNVRQASALAEALRRAMHHQHWPDGVRVTASFGVAQHATPDEIGTVIRHADEALCQAKAGGRDQVRVHAPDAAAAPPQPGGEPATPA